MLICLGQGAHGRGRVNALMAKHIASLSLPFLFTLLAQRPAATELKSEGGGGDVSLVSVRGSDLSSIKLFFLVCGFPLRATKLERRHEQNDIMIRFV